MADLIERDAALAYIDCCLGNSLGGRKEFDSGLMQARKFVTRIPAVNRWISVEERLPEVYEKVLTYNDDGIIHDNFRLNLKDGSVGWSQGWGITHWQPRPEPPEKE